MTDFLSPKQLEFIAKSTAKWNLAHGPVRSGKTVAGLFRFMQAAHECPDSQIWMIGHTVDTIFHNAVRLIFEFEPFAIFKPFCSWHPGKRVLKFRDKSIGTLGAKDEGAIGSIQGKTMSVVYCDEFTLFPEMIIDMIDTRLSNPHSIGIASMNPSYPTHKIKKWIDKADEGDFNYYAQQITLDDNPFLPDDYKLRLKNSLSGLFYKRNYLGLWCLAEGAIFDFFDRNLYVVDRPPCAAEYWIAGIDYGAQNPFVCLLIGVTTGRSTQSGHKMWVEKEYYWDPKAKGRQKTNYEFAEDVYNFLEPYYVKNIYIDPSAESFSLDLKKMGLHTTHANNQVLPGITHTISEMKKGNLFICSECVNTIREIEHYVWDSKAAKRGIDEPMKVDDHSCVTGDTMVLVDGIKFRIDELIYNRKGKVFSWDMEKDFLCKDIILGAARTREDVDVYEIELEDGKTIKCTFDHRFVTPKGYIPVNELTLCDMLLVVDDEEDLWEQNIKFTLEENFI
jgi:PBSX family phage terminase large subunit